MVTVFVSHFLNLPNTPAGYYPNMVQYPVTKASPTSWSCYANISAFIDRTNNEFPRKLIMMI